MQTGQEAKAELQIGATLQAKSLIDVPSKSRGHYLIECYDAHGQLKWTESFWNVNPDVGMDFVTNRTFMGTNAGDGRRLPNGWAVGTAYSVGQYVKPVASPGTRYWVCSIAGTSHASTEPTWPTPAYSATAATTYTITDNTATWQAADRLFIGLKGSATAVATTDTMASKGWTESTAYSNATRTPFLHGSLKVVGSGRGIANDTGSGGTVCVFNINGTATIYGAFMCDLGVKAGTLGTLYSAADFAAGSRAVLNGDTLNVTVTLSFT
jgi:hypothetical protein